ncbi:MAG TPA: ATP synthase F0 subunit B [Dissulfurispiraceae bacterium]|nr:ATP synthase F0 subunit B [Dissulfurispiraceae bacterium]
MRKKNVYQLLILVAAVALLFIAFPSLVLAAEEGEHHGTSVMDWVWKIVNFGILVGVLSYFLAKPIKEHLKLRRDLIEKSINEGREAKALAAKALAEVEERLKLKDKEVADIISSAVESGEREKARLIEEGEKLKVKIMEQAKTNIDFELKKAKEAIQAEAVEASIKLAEEKIKAKMTPQEQERLLKESIKLIEGKN